MIALLPLMLQATPPPFGLGTLARQQMPARGCAAFLWTLDTPRLVAMAGAEPAHLRLALDGGSPTDLPRVAQHGEGGFGLAGETDYGADGTTATLALTIATRSDLSDGGTVTAATLTIARPAHDTVVVPLAGLVGCSR